MAYTVAKSFDECHENIRLTSAQKQTVVARKNNISGYLASAFGQSTDMPLTSVTAIGSAQRDTMIRPFNDLDLMAHFANDGAWGVYKANSQQFLYRVRDALNKHSRVQIVGARGQAVRFFYSDGLHVDVAPVFKYTSGGYALPNGTGGWVTTDPAVHAAYIDRREGELKGSLKKIIRLVKQWNREHGSRLKSFHLEIMVASAFTTLDNDSRDALHVFFRWASNNLAVSDPAGYSRDLSSYLTNLQRQEVIASLRSAEDRANRANQAEIASDHREAIRLWRILLGDSFPAYG